MKPIAFFDTEIEPDSKQILDIGAIKSDGNIFHSNSIKDFTYFLENTEFICGHNIIKHDLIYIKKYLFFNEINKFQIIDTLFLSPLLFPKRPYHRLLKDDKLQTDELNNPVNDSQKARDLFNDEITAFIELNDSLKQIYFSLLKDREEFRHFFTYLSYIPENEIKLESTIKECFYGKICSNSSLENIINQHPIELAYCLSLINVSDRYSITPPWVLMNYPEIDRIMYLLRNKPCVIGCTYCNEALDAKKGLKRYFGFDSFRIFEEESLQENAVKAAIENRSLLAVFPTGGGKSLTFQIPALMIGENTRGLTVVISPLQSLMKDQVDNLEKLGITEAVTINGLLDPIERGKSFERVADGSASILYISPESLRSRTIEHLFLGRKIARFVIDEAHCFSSWGQDFRVDYLYIADFIKSLEEKKNLTERIPVSCFTATAKQKVIEDICSYFNEKLAIKLKIFKSNASRTNLKYRVHNSIDEEEKYCKLRALIESKNCPTIVYVSRTRKAFELAQRLSQDGLDAKPYHGKMDVKEKTDNQNAFIAGEIPIMVATSAFGMGVDKKDIGMVIHYEISDSLENYVQESGRAGRDENISADCFVLYNEEDLNKHFILLNQTKISVKEIQQIWKAIKYITKFRSTVSNSALEIARKAGWDDRIVQIENRAKTAIAALEQAGYLQRGQNVPRIYADSILSKNAEQAIEKINSSVNFDEKQKVQAIRIIKMLISSKRKKEASDETAESRVDYISDILGIAKEDVIRAISLMKEEKILANTRDLTAYIKQSDKANRSLSILKSFAQIENFLLPLLSEQEKVFQLKELNEAAIENGCSNVNPQKIKTILNFWAIKNRIKLHYHSYSKNHISVFFNQSSEDFREKLGRKHTLAEFIVSYLYKKMREVQSKEDSHKKEILVEFSVHELKKSYKKELKFFQYDISIDDIEDTLFYLSRIEAIKIEGGFLIVYNKLTINRLEQNNKIQYKNEDYRQLDMFYQNKIQQIHIVGEYAKKMLEDYNVALKFVDDYFQLNYFSFLNKYFPGSRKDEIKQNITPSKFRELFGSLSPRQLKIIKDNLSKHIVVAAGPGSGKTRVLVHKLASLLLMEDVKHEQLLMLTFSRAAATEFKKRLLNLIGNAANFIEIKTFHSYCFDLLGRIGNLDKSEKIVRDTTEKIMNGEVETNRITKTVLVIDEAQDMDADEFALVKSLMDRNEEMRVIAVGDDDQNIYTFRGADSKYFEQFIKEKSSVKYELIENYRGKRNLVEFTNQFVLRIQHRFKTTQIEANQRDTGNIKLIHYRCKNLIVPLVNDLLSAEFLGTTSVLTQTNNEALQITGLLLKNGMPAKLIQANDGFDLYNLLEIRTFLEDISIYEENSTIGKETWKNAKKKFVKKHKNSSNFELCKILIKDFQITNPKIKYKSDFKVFIKESRLEDFILKNNETIYVSTIHKAKGKEFDNVYLLLDNFDANSDEKKRQLYVAMTRAKQNLTIHLNGFFLNNIKTENLLHKNDSTVYSAPMQLVLHLTHKDIQLSYFGFIQHRINLLHSGQILSIAEEGLTNSKDELILKFSKHFMNTKASLEKKGYRLTSGKVNFILYWKMQNGKEDDNQEVKIVLPELGFERKDETTN
ncbi:MAG: RecQ family ATP-dependent DNA helicase [Candidatus Cloacimonetes bacterium]|nr:RecQ family ATP-dependent DNA helicase [Candidatus Cloacimonadota bacterium]